MEITKHSRPLLALAVLAFLTGSASPGQGLLQERFKQRFAKFNADQSNSSQSITIAGLKVAVWAPAQSDKPSPVVIFSHGFHGANTQSVFLMKALADAGYLVFAPNHRDAIGGGGAFSKPETGFGKADKWNENTYKDRGEDITRLVQALHNDPEWNRRIDWSKLALAGHSLGGYTALALAGAWPSWTLPGVKAVLALSPYSEPFVVHGTLQNLHVPVMYQGGTRDFGITPFLKRPNGAFAQTPSPAYFVEFDKVSHFSFSNLGKDPNQQNLISQYSIAFLNKYVLGQATTPEAKADGVVDLEVK